MYSKSWARAEKQCGNIELARILFRQGLKKVPSHGALWQASAVMEMQQGNIDVARTLFAQALSRCPTHEQQQVSSPHPWVQHALVSRRIATVIRREWDPCMVRSWDYYLRLDKSSRSQGEKDDGKL